MRQIIKEILVKMFRLFGVRAVFWMAKRNRKGLNLNIGAGKYEIQGFVSLDLYTPFYYPDRKEFDNNRVHYDMRGGTLPYDTESVSNIYCSHVIEHIETEFVESFFRESHRVLVDGGCLRVVCPDAKFLYNMMMADGDYFLSHPFYSKERNDNNVSCFVRATATHKLDLPNFGLDREINTYTYKELMNTLREGGVFDESLPGRHINNWDFERIKTLAIRCGFSKVLESKVGGSVSAELQGPDMDLTIPRFSLHVDMMKGKET